MRMIFRYMKAYARRIASSMTVKLLGAVTELLIPYILEHLIDEVVPLGQMRQVILWGLLMVATALVTRQLNVWANRMAIDNAHNVSYDIRQDLFTKTANLSGAQFDAFGLPSLISRMTSDSYNVQSCVQTLQTLCVRVPMMLLGGICVTLMMDAALSAILCVMVPVLIVVILCVSRYGIPLYRKVQERLDDVVRVMREDISGIRVVKALSKTEYEKRRFSLSNEAMTRADIKASTIMAIPGPLMQMCLNIGLTLVVWLGAARVDSGQIKPGVILAFLTYFNMVLQGVMGVNRIFIMVSKASASANRIARVLEIEPDQRVLAPEEAGPPPATSSFALSTSISATARQRSILWPAENGNNASMTSTSPSGAAKAWVSSAPPAVARAPSSICSCAFMTWRTAACSWTDGMCAPTKRTSCTESLAWCFKTIWCSSTPCGKTSALAGIWMIPR